MSENRLATIVLAGNPNVGKSTIFNCLTGMRQHTGNWAGKTVANAEGLWRPKGLDKDIKLVDAPGCYSLAASSAEELVARKQICDPLCQGIIIVCDGTCLERNLILALQILRHRKDCILCINLMDEVRRKGIEIDTEKLGRILGIKVITTESSKKDQIKLKMSSAVLSLLDGELQNNSTKARCYIPELIDDPEDIAKSAELIASEVISYIKRDFSLKGDQILTSPLWGFPIMIMALMSILWFTIQGANYPSELLGRVLLGLEEPLHDLLRSIGVPLKVCDMIACGMYRVLAWVVSVMLPPMAIFFPLFTLLEDLGFLPRVAFNLDRCFKGCKACGKQALTMCMGLGCNASAVIGCRIIDSKRERLLAMLTNSIIPCNGRFPILIAMTSMFFAEAGGLVPSALLTFFIIFSIFCTFIATFLLSKTLLKGVTSAFVLELPPFRKPEIKKIIIRSILDRTIFVLTRAVIVSAPAGMIIWLLSNIYVGNISVIAHISLLLDPFGKLIGLDGVIITAFILGLPANEIVLPIAMMIYMSQGTLVEITDLDFFRELLVSNGWTMLTAINMMVFTLMHWPCGTTILSIKKETGSFKWPIVSILLPFVMGSVICFFINSSYRFFL